MTTAINPGAVVFAELDEAMTPPCELGRLTEPCGRPAAWVMWRSPCSPGCATYRLACTDCKESRIHSDAGVVCGTCGVVKTPARDAYVRVEAL